MNSLSDLIGNHPFSSPFDKLDEDKKHLEEKTEDTADNADNIDMAELSAVIYSIKDQLDGLLRLLGNKQIQKLQKDDDAADVQIMATGEKIIEGVFDGEKMIGSDGREYSIPANYASKSKLVEGDIMKLTITNKGSFIYKQIGPIERKRIVGELVSDASTGQWNVLADGRAYKILTASVTFFKGKSGDEVVILVPQTGESQWAAVENIISK
ncbi:MAG: hypothetical protein WC862_04765 [Patescibacteria group bacterium]